MSAPMEENTARTTWAGIKRVFRPLMIFSPNSQLAGYLTVTWIVASLWVLSYTVTKFQMNFKSESFSILLLLLTALAGGQITSLIKCPPLLGMLLVGILWRNGNVTQVDFATQISSTWLYILRNLAMVVILLRGAFGLNLSALRSNWSIILRLSFTPCILEAVTWAYCSNLLLYTPWMPGFLLGFVMSAASAAVVIPIMLQFAERGIGCDKGITTITIAATSIDNVTSMVAFGIVHSLTFSTGSLLENVGAVPAQILIGILFGVIWGCLLRYLPSPDQRQGHVIAARIVLLLCGGVVAIFGGHALNYSGAGPLGCLISGFIANISWRQQSGWGKHVPNPVAEVLAGLWIFFEPLLFGLIGSQIVISQLDPRLIGYGLLILLIGLAVRFIVSFVVIMGGQLSWKDRLFVAVTWLPKATVQAALGPVALETVRRLNAGPEVEQMAQNILTLAALSILITAPIGTIAMQFSGPVLLEKSRLRSVDNPAQEHQNEL